MAGKGNSEIIVPAADQAPAEVDSYAFEGDELLKLNALQRPEALLTAISIQSSYFQSVYSASWSESAFHHALALVLVGWNAATLREAVRLSARINDNLRELWIALSLLSLFCTVVGWIFNYKAIRAAMQDVMDDPHELLANIEIDGDASKSMLAETRSVIRRVGPWVSQMQEIGMRRIKHLGWARVWGGIALLLAAVTLPLWIIYSAKAS